MKFSDLNLPSFNDITRIEQIKKEHGNELEKVDNFFNVLTPDDAFFLSRFIGSQGKASAIEGYLIKKLNGTKVNASDERGDCLANSKYIELKTSTSNKNQAINIRQIRPWHNLDYYICSYVDDVDITKSKCYVLTKKEMIEEIKLMGSFTHGTKSSNIENNNREYSITIYPYSPTNKNTQRWDKKYLSQEYYKKLF